MEIKSHPFLPYFSDEAFVTRIKRIGFKNFRNIENGYIETENSEISDFLDEKPSIIGLYGQNGSGKSSVIMALSILKSILSGETINNEKYWSCIRYGCDRCTLTFIFTIYYQYINDKGIDVFNKGESNCFEVFYKFDIVRKKENSSNKFKDSSLEGKETLTVENELFQYKIINNPFTNLPNSIFHEIFGISNPFKKKYTFLDTRAVSPHKKSFAFKSSTMEKIYSAYDATNKHQLKKYYNKSIKNSQSFVFYQKTFELLDNIMLKTLEKQEIANWGSIVFKNAINVTTEASKDEFENKMNEYFSGWFSEIDNSDDQAMIDAIKKLDNILKDFMIYVPVQLVRALRNFGKTYLHVIDTVITGITNINAQLPLLLWHKEEQEGIRVYNIPLDMNGSTCVPERYYSEVEQSLNTVSNVLEKIVPDLRLVFIDKKLGVSQNNEVLHYFEIASQRKNDIIPLRFESDGIRRIVSILSLLIAAYNNETVTIAIDEIDSGIFEYLLGEIFIIMEDSAKGQFFFTSHNLRPLEVLSPEYLIFTTTNPKKRFIKIENRDDSNLRNTYFRSIVLDTQKETVYNGTDRYEIDLAFHAAGRPEIK